MRRDATTKTRGGGGLDGRTTSVTPQPISFTPELVEYLHASLQPHRKKRSAKGGFKRPPHKVALLFTRRDFRNALASLSKRIPVEKLGAMYQVSRESFRDLIVQELKRLSYMRSVALADWTPAFEQWERKKRRMSYEERLTFLGSPLWNDRGIYRRKCGHCGKGFYCMRPHARYCSRVCRSAARTRELAEDRRNRRNTYCRQCYKRFKATRADSRFCSSTCRVKHFRAKRAFSATRKK